MQQWKYAIALSASCILFCFCICFCFCTCFSAFVLPRTSPAPCPQSLRRVGQHCVFVERVLCGSTLPLLGRYFNTTQPTVAPAGQTAYSSAGHKCVIYIKRVHESILLIQRWTVKVPVRVHVDEFVSAPPEAAFPYCNAGSVKYGSMRRSTELTSRTCLVPPCIPVRVSVCPYQRAYRLVWTHCTFYKSALPTRVRVPVLQ